MDLEKRLKAAGLGRFQVMALLQAARYYILYNDIDKAKSFGLNRAIFYAWAKYHGPHTMVWKQAKIGEVLRKGNIDIKTKSKCSEGFIEVLGECVQLGSRGFYVIGDKEQTPEDYDYQVTKKLGRITDPEKVWKAALEYVKQFPRWVLEDPQRFYKLVYEPIRDRFLLEVVSGSQPKPPEHLINRFKSLEEMYRKSESKQKRCLTLPSNE
uniref:Uncharacterized protein n=1 Tax=Ignisphaera aggregans TaxID=334771 RepID=A0A7C2VKW5_9CREN